MNLIESNNEIDAIDPEDNSSVIIDIPFNPNDINGSIKPLNVGDIIDRLEHGEIKFNTEYQRLPHLWNDTQKSRFIESILLNFPIPAFYFDAQDDNLWRVIDGLQRVATLKSFLIDKGEKQLALTGLEFLKDLKDKKIEGLSREQQRRIKTTSLLVYVLDKTTPNAVKYNIFSRINKGGLILKPQEIRNALHQGIASEFIADLVRNEDLVDEKGEIEKKATEEGILFHKVTQNKISSLRMEDRDFATRFVAFYLQSYKKYQPDLDTFVNEAMNKLKKLSVAELQDIKEKYTKSLKISSKIFKNDAFRKRFAADDTRKPINKALFEVLMVSFAHLTDKERNILLEKKEVFKNNLMKLQSKSDEKFLKAISTATATKEAVEERFSSMEKLINQTINS